MSLKVFWMPGEIQLMWLNSLKIAIIEKNTDAMDKLLDDIPEFSDKQELQEAIYLSREALELLHTLKDEASLNMSKIQKNISFLKSTEVRSSTRLDIKS